MQVVGWNVQFPQHYNSNVNYYAIGYYPDFAPMHVFRNNLVLLIGALLSVASLFSSAEPAPSKPNIVIILADDMGWGDPSCYPQQRERPGVALETPEIDRLAASGIKFMQAYATSPICNPSRAGLLTGRYQQQFGYYAFYESLAGIPKEVPTLAELLKKDGYATAMFGKWHVSFRVDNGPLARGFDRFFGFTGGQHDYYDSRLGEACMGVGFSDDDYLWDQKEPLVQGDMPYLTDAITDHAVEYIREMGQSHHPFFLYLPYNCPHPPLQAKWEFLKNYFPDPHSRNFSERDLVRAMIGSLDEGLGKIEAQIKASGLEKNTLVMFTSDNGGHDDGPGGQLIDHDGGLRPRKGFFWEGGIRIPFIMSWPGHLPAGMTYQLPISHLDIAPTILAQVDSTLPSGSAFDGVNLMPFLHNENKGTPHSALFWGFDESAHRWAVRDGDWKLISDSPNPKDQSEFPELREKGLFNLALDPRETKNVLAENPEKARELQELINKFYVKCLPSLVTPEEEVAWKVDFKKRMQVLGGNQDKLRRDGYPGAWR